MYTTSVCILLTCTYGEEARIRACCMGKSLVSVKESSGKFRLMLKETMCDNLEPIGDGVMCF